MGAYDNDPRVDQYNEYEYDLMVDGITTTVVEQSPSVWVVQTPQFCEAHIRTGRMPEAADSFSTADEAIASILGPPQ